MSDDMRTNDEVASLRAQLEQEVARLNRLLEIGTQLNSTLKLDELLEQIMEGASEVVGAETSSLLLVDEDTGELIVSVATGDPGQRVLRVRIPSGQGIAGHVVESGEPLVVENPREDPRFYSAIDEQTGFETRNLLAVPLRTAERVIGAIEVINKRSGAFDDQDVRIAAALAGQAAAAVENARLNARLADAVVTSRLSYRL
jgi:phosphoserine phosphatase RsbU/P